MADSTIGRVQGGNVYDAVFTDKKDNASMDQTDFLKLLIAQMQNQDFNNPMDNTQMVQQMAAFSNMQMMQQMASYSKTNYAMSLVGKTVTASRYGVNGTLDSTTGLVEKISLIDNEYVIYVGGKKYSLEQIMSIEEGKTGDSSVINPKNFTLKVKDKDDHSVSIEWQIPTEDEQAAEKLKYTVYYSTEPGFNTVEAVEKGTQSGAKEAKNLKESEITELEPNTTYYINVVVTDGNGKKSVYEPVKVTTRM